MSKCTELGNIALKMIGSGVEGYLEDAQALAYIVAKTDILKAIAFEFRSCPPGKEVK